jgi:hypothetical protein
MIEYSPSQNIIFYSSQTIYPFILRWYFQYNNVQLRTQRPRRLQEYANTDTESSAEGKFSILSGMKIKKSKEPATAAQTETNLNFTESMQEDIKSKAHSKDDSDINKK